MTFPKASDFPEIEPPTQVTVRVPSPIMNRIKNDVDTWNASHPKSPETLTDRINYLLDYAYQAGSLNDLVDRMRAQYFDVIAAAPEQLAQGVSTYNQVVTLKAQVDNLDDRTIRIEEKLQELINIMVKN